MNILCCAEQEKREKSPRYQAWLAEQIVLEEFRQEEELRLQRERHLQWERDEVIAHQQWEERQEKLKRAREEKAKQEVRKFCLGSCYIYQGKSNSLCPYFFRPNDECKTKTNIYIRSSGLFMGRSS